MQNIEFEILVVTKGRIGVFLLEMYPNRVGGAEGAPMRSGGGVGACGRRRRPPWRPHYGPERIEISKMKLIGGIGGVSADLGVIEGTDPESELRFEKGLL